MRVFDAHRQLSDLVGDSIDVTGVNITGNTFASNMPDGARFTAVMKDVCLTRALYDVLRGAVNSVVPLPRSQGARLLQNAFPQSSVKVTWVAPTPVTVPFRVTFNSVTSGGTGNPQIARRPLYIYAMRRIAANGTYIPIPFKTGIEASGLLNSRVVQVSDAFAVYEANSVGAPFNWTNNFGFPDGVIAVYDRQGDIIAADVLELEYLGLPPAITSTTSADIMRVIELDQIRISQMLALAQLYMHISGQDIESIERYLPTMLDINKE